MENREVKYGLPAEVQFCKCCVISNQRPVSMVEHRSKDNNKKTINIDEDGICDACRVAEAKMKIDWGLREKELMELCDRHRRNDGNYDCIVPGSGGKDSIYQSHVLKYKYGMNPLTVTWAPIMYTDYGYKNFKNWIDVGGFDNMLFNRNGTVAKKLTYLAFEKLFHPFQPFVLGQKNWPIKMAVQLKIPLVFYGENEADYQNPIADSTKSIRDKSFHTYENLNDLYLSGVSLKELKEEHQIGFKDVKPYLPCTAEDFEKSDIEVHYLGYYLKWIPQEVYYYAVENAGFQARPFRTQGTYQKYMSIDDKVDDFHFYCQYIKFGIGRATFDAAQEVRNKHLTREEGIALVEKFDGEFPDRYFNEIMNYIDMKPEYFLELCDKFRSPHLWGKSADGSWKLNHTVGGKGLED